MNENVGFTLVQLRTRAGITQKALADALGVTDHTVRNWEKGREEPKLHIWQVKTLCRLLQCDLSELPDFFKQNADRADDAIGMN